MVANIKIFVGDIMKALEIIKLKRKEKGFNQDYMAEKLQMARSSYQAIESGINNMNIIDFFKILEILEIPLTLFSDDEIIVLEKKDLNELIYHSNEMQKLINKIEKTSTISIGDNNNIQIGSNISYNKGDK